MTVEIVRVGQRVLVVPADRLYDGLVDADYGTLDSEFLGLAHVHGDEVVSWFRRRPRDRHLPFGLPPDVDLRGAIA